MKSPITGKEMLLIKKVATISFRKETFKYNHFNYLCEDSKESFTTTELDELNINQVYNQYRDKHNIPFPDEIKSLRKKLGLPASKISQLLGFGVNSYRNYEKGEVPSLANANLISLIASDTKAFKNLVSLNNDLSDSEKKKIFIKVNQLIELEKECSSDFDYVKNLFGGNMLPDNFSGYIRPNMKKLSEMIVYFTIQLEPTKTMMNKLLFYADFLNYKKTGYSISGTRYVAHNYGPVPDRFYGIFDYCMHNKFVSFSIEQYGNGYVGERFQSTDKPFIQDTFSEVELTTMKTVFEQFKDFNATQIMEVSHNETAWIENQEERTMIDYNYGFELKHI